MRAITTILLLAFSLSTFAQTAREISERATNAMEFDAMEMVSTLTIYDNRGNERVRQVATATRKFGNTTKTMIRFLSPPDVQGTTMLVHDHQDGGEDMWIYLPSLRRERRIVSSEKGNSFMGSDFTNADMTSPNLDDFNYNLLGTETINGKDCWVVESVCKTEEIEDENGYHRSVSYIEKRSYLAQKVEYYDLSNRLHRVMTISDYREQSNGQMFAFSMEVKNVQSNRRSKMRVDQFQLGSGLNKSDFSVSSMSR